MIHRIPLYERRLFFWWQRAGTMYVLRLFGTERFWVR
jgi:hypothetical protein